LTKFKDKDLNIEKIRKDYDDFLIECGFTQAFVNSILDLDTIDDKDSKSLVVVKKSDIEGVGMFAIRNIKKSEYIAMGKVNGSRVLAGRYTNHSPDPNAIFVALENGDILMEAISDIEINEEVTVDYRQAIVVSSKKINKMQSENIVQTGFDTNDVNDVEVINNNTYVPLTGTRDEIIDIVESLMVEYPQLDLPLVHRFTDNMYVREISVPAGSWLTTKIHKHEHPFVLSKGSITMWDGETQMDISAPFGGITKENTRRIVFVHEDCVFTTFHVTDKKTVEEVEDEILIKHDNPLLSKSVKELFKLN
jgi:mannose-6-phosphate isomerase-like protein (cupin superfamily)